MAQDLIGNLERIGWRMEPTGGNLRAMRKGRLFLTDTGGDLPYADCFVIALYSDAGDGNSLVWSLSDDDMADGRTIDDALAIADRQALAHEFSETLRAELSEDDWREMRERNRTYGAGVCASHDFCDANMVMEQAFSVITGRAILPDDGPPSDADRSLWNDAWYIAKCQYLTV